MPDYIIHLSFTLPDSVNVIDVANKIIREVSLDVPSGVALAIDRKPDPLADLVPDATSADAQPANVDVASNPIPSRPVRSARPV
jgi:hypothetical protein